MKNAIYQIVNTVTNVRYIGQAVKFRRRKTDHLCGLRGSYHYNEYLQRAYDKYGEENFIFEVIDQVRHREELTLREQYWMDKYDFKTELYNLFPIAGNSGQIFTKEIRRKMFWSNPNKKTIAQIDIATGDILAIYPGIMEADRITGVDFRNISAVCNEKGGRIATGGYGWAFATGNEIILDKYKNIVFKNKNIPRLVAQVDINTDKIISLFDSPIHAARENGLHASHISTVCLGNRKTTGGYKWRYVDKETNEFL